MNIIEIKPLAVEEDIDVAEHRIERSRVLYRWSQFVDNVAEPEHLDEFLRYLAEHLLEKNRSTGALDPYEFDLLVVVYDFMQESQKLNQAREYCSEEQLEELRTEYLESYKRIQEVLYSSLPRLFPIEI